MEGKVWLEGDVLDLKLVGVIDAKEALEVELAVREIFKKERRPLNVFIDLREAEDVDARAKKILAETVKADSPMVMKTAILYSDMRTKVRAMMVMYMGDRKNIVFFTDEKKARDWIRP